VGEGIKGDGLPASGGRDLPSSGRVNVPDNVMRMPCTNRWAFQTIPQTNGRKPSVRPRRKSDSLINAEVCTLFIIPHQKYMPTPQTAPLLKAAAGGSGVTQVLKRLEARAARNRSLANKLEQPTKPSRANGRPRFPHHCRARCLQGFAPLPRLCRARCLSPACAGRSRYRAVPGLLLPRNCRARSPEGYRAVPVILSFPLRRLKLPARPLPSRA